MRSQTRTQPLTSQKPAPTDLYRKQHTVKSWQSVACMDARCNFRGTERLRSTLKCKPSIILLAAVVHSELSLGTIYSHTALSQCTHHTGTAEETIPGYTRYTSHSCGRRDMIPSNAGVCRAVTSGPPPIHTHKPQLVSRCGWCWIVSS
jgi:hypothetical protein